VIFNSLVRRERYFSNWRGPYQAAKPSLPPTPSNTPIAASNGEASTQPEHTPTSAPTEEAGTQPENTPTSAPTEEAGTEPQAVSPPDHGVQEPEPAAPAPALAPRQPIRAYRTYVVQRGDILKQIAARFGVSMTSILAINNIPNPDSLTVGQVLTIPPAGS